MSNGLHHVTAAPASFFPTAKELSSGLQWFKDHPILAAAAATAVSVITYLNTAESEGDLQLAAPDDGEDDAHGRGHIGDHDHDVDDLDARFGRRRGAVRMHGTALMTTMASTTATSSMTKRTPHAEGGERDRIGPQRHEATATVHASKTATTAALRQPTAGRATPPALRKPGSDAKISSPAAVSWVDEHGGSLTQVFEHLSAACVDGDDDDDDDDDGHEPDVEEETFPDLDGGPVVRCSSRENRPRRRGRPPSRVTGAHAAPPLPPHPRRTGTETPDAAAIHSPLPPERQSESPQWGWYVPITPPQDHLQQQQQHPHAARVSSTETVAMRAAASTMVATHARADEASTGGTADPTASSSSLRRSTSGRIKA